MARISKQKMKRYEEANAILEKDSLTEEEKDFVFEHWLPEIDYDVGGSGVFFTPYGISHELAVMLGDCPSKVVDLCAGIGRLSYTVNQFRRWGETPIEITAIERNPRYVEVGKKILPEANWICMDVFDENAWNEQGFEDDYFDVAISNPPFGQIGHSHWRGLTIPADLTCVAVALDKTKYGGLFILPNTSVPWNCSGTRSMSKKESTNWNKVEERYPEVNCQSCSCDLDVYLEEWQGVSPKVELADIKFGV